MWQYRTREIVGAKKTWRQELIHVYQNDLAYESAPYSLAYRSRVLVFDRYRYICDPTLISIGRKFVQ